MHRPHLLKHPRTGAPIVPIGSRKDGTAIWPILGGSEGDPPAGDPPAGDPPAGDPPKTFTQAELDAIVSDRLKRQKNQYADYDKYKADSTELAQFKAANATDLEKAIQAAKDETRSTVIAELGVSTATEILRGQLKAQYVAAGKDPAGQEAADAIEAVLGDLNLGRYVDDQGVIDQAGLAAVAARHAVAKAPASFDLGQGGSGGGGKSLDQQIAEAQAKGDPAELIRLNNLKLAAVVAGGK